MSSRSEVVKICDKVVADFLQHGEGYLGKLPNPLDCWFKAYAGTGDGRVVRDAFPEPYIGDLAAGKIRAVTLGLNPGQTYPKLQGQDGDFANEIRALKSYHRWAATHPYFGETWLHARRKRNPYYESRLRFLRDWFGSCFRCDQMLNLELYPWHSRRMRGRIRVCPEIMRRFIWEPIAEMGNPLVFAFGAPWMKLIETQGKAMGLTIKACLRPRHFRGAVRSRHVLVARTPEGALVVAEKHMGFVGPPRRDQAEYLRKYVCKHFPLRLKRKRKKPKKSP